MTMIDASSAHCTSSIKSVRDTFEELVMTSMKRNSKYSADVATHCHSSQLISSADESV
jgi:hypothetical protein